MMNFSVIKLPLNLEAKKNIQINMNKNNYLNKNSYSYKKEEPNNRFK